MFRLVELCEEIGFRFHLDLEGELEVVAPIAVNGGDVTVALEARAEELKHYVARRAKRLRHQCVGGPYQGRLHRGWQQGGAVLFHVERGKWAAYVVGKDGRAWFVGYATSKQKARQLVNRSGHQPRSRYPKVTR